MLPTANTLNMNPYRDLETRFGRLGAVEEAIAVLHWDAATMMPPGGAAARADQLAALRVVAHRLLTAPEMPGLLDAADAEAAGLDDWRRANLREMRRRWNHAAAVPEDLVAALSQACSHSETAWRAARPANDFAAALPGLEQVLRLTREMADAKAGRLGLSPYDALLDQYQPGVATARSTACSTSLPVFCRNSSMPRWRGRKPNHRRRRRRARFRSRRSAGRR